MPFVVYKWLAGIGVLAILVFGAYLKGRSDANSNWEAIQAKAVAAAAEESARLLKEKETLVAKYEKDKQDAQASNLRAADAVKRLRDSIASMSRNPTVPVSSATSAEVGNVLGDCAQEYRIMAETADTLYGKLQLSQTIYESIRKRSK